MNRKKGVLLTTYGMVLHNSAALKLQQHGRSDDSDRCWDFMILDEVTHMRVLQHWGILHGCSMIYLG